MGVKAQGRVSLEAGVTEHRDLGLGWGSLPGSKTIGLGWGPEGQPGTQVRVWRPSRRP
jgi:hypothetical protein